MLAASSVRVLMPASTCFWICSSCYLSSLSVAYYTSRRHSVPIGVFEKLRIRVLTYVFFEIFQLLFVLDYNKLDALINRLLVIVVDVLETTKIQRYVLNLVTADDIGH